MTRLPPDAAPDSNRLDFARLAEAWPRLCPEQRRQLNADLQSLLESVGHYRGLVLTLRALNLLSRGVARMRVMVRSGHAMRAAERLEMIARGRVESVFPMGDGVAEHDNPTAAEAAGCSEGNQAHPVSPRIPLALPAARQR